MRVVHLRSSGLAAVSVLAAGLALSSLNAGCAGCSGGTTPTEQPATPHPVLSDVAPTSLHLTSLAGGRVVGTFSFRNSGTGDLIWSATTPDSFLRLPASPVHLGEGESMTVAVEGTCPATAGTLNGTVKLKSNGGEDAVVAVELGCTVVAPAKGSLAVAVSGLPTGVVGSVTIMGPNGFTQGITSTATLQDLEAGNYSVTANNVDQGQDHFVAVVGASPVAVAAGGVALTTVSYTLRPAALPVAGENGRLTAFEVLQRSVVLQWAAAVDLQTPAANLEYRVYRSSTSNITSTQEAQDNGTAVNGWTPNLTQLKVEELEPMTGAFFNVLVKDGESNLAAYRPVSVFTLPNGAPTPGGQGVLSLDAITDNSVSLTWARAQDDLTPAAGLEYRVFHAAGLTLDTVEATLDVGIPDGDWTTNMASAQVNGLPQASLHTFNVLVKDAQGIISAYNQVRATTLDTTAPQATTAPLITHIRGTSLHLDWTAATDNAASMETLSYRLFVGTQSMPTLDAAQTNGRDLTRGWAVAVTSLEATQLTSETAYTFQLFVKDPAGNVTAYPEATANTLAPQAPLPGGDAHLTVDAITSTSVTISWAPAVLGTANGPLQYRVVHSALPNVASVDGAFTHGTWDTPWTTSLSTFTVENLPTGTPVSINVLVRNGLEEMAAYDQSNNVTVDILPPVLPMDGPLLLQVVPPGTVKLSWGRATDGTTPQSLLQYAVVRTEPGSNLPSPWTPDVGVMVVEWTVDLTHAVEINLIPGQDYEYVVFVRDQTGNFTAYAPIHHTTPLGSNVTLFVAGNAQGDLGGRAGADALCAATSLTCSNGVHAFLSVDANDEIRDMPLNYGITNTTTVTNEVGGYVADNWDDLVDGLSDSLFNFGVTPQYQRWWTGTLPNGSLGKTCQGWTVAPPFTSQSSSIGGGGGSVEYGAATSSDSPYTFLDNAYPCAFAALVLCVCY